MEPDKESLTARVDRLEAELGVAASDFYALTEIMEGILALETGAKDEGARRSFAQVAVTRLREIKSRFKFEESERQP